MCSFILAWVGRSSYAILHSTQVQLRGDAPDSPKRRLAHSPQFHLFQWADRQLWGSVSGLWASSLQSWRFLAAHIMCGEMNVSMPSNFSNGTPGQVSMKSTHPQVYELLRPSLEYPIPIPASAPSKQGPNLGLLLPTVLQ